MPEVSATDAARKFADLLDAIEHRGENYTIVRRGKAIARLAPVSLGQGAEAKAVLRRHRADAAWADDVASVRRLVAIEERT